MDAQELEEQFALQAQWRREKAAQYPDDERNADAATLFDRLAETVKHCPPDVIDTAGSAFGDERGTETWQEMMRQVGFHTWPQTAEEFCRSFIVAALGDPGIPEPDD